MLKFLERAYNQANEELALLGTYEADMQKSGKGGKSSVTKNFAVKKQGGGYSDGFEYVSNHACRGFGS